MQFSALAKKVLPGSVLRVVNLFVGVVISLFLIPFIVHHLGDRLYGFWSLVGTFVGYYGLLDLGLSSAVSQFVCVAIGRNDTAGCREVFNTAFRIQSIMGGVALLVTVLIAAAAPWFCHDASDASLFWKIIILLGVNAAITFPMKVFSGVLDAELRYDIQSILDFFGLLLRTALTVLAISMGGKLLALAWVTLIASLPVMALQMWFARREASWARIERTSIDRQKAKSLFSYSIYTSISSMADTLRFSLDSVVITGFVGLAAVTHYKVAGVFSRYYIGIILALMGPLQPILSRLHGEADTRKKEKAFFFATKITVWVSVPVCLGLIAWGKPFITRWMGTAYTDAYLPLVFLTIAVFLDVCQNPSVALLNSTFKHRSYAYVNLTEGIINLIASLLLARPLGITGVALGTLIGAFVVRLIMQPWWTCKASGIHFGEYMKFLGGVLLRSGILIGVIIAVTSWGLKPNYQYIATSVLLATALYLAGSFWVVFNPAERKQLLTIVTATAQQWTEPSVACVTD